MDISKHSVTWLTQHYASVLNSVREEWQAYEPTISCHILANISFVMPNSTNLGWPVGCHLVFRCERVHKQ